MRRPSRRDNARARDGRREMRPCKYVLYGGFGERSARRSSGIRNLHRALRTDKLEQTARFRKLLCTSIKPNHVVPAVEQPIDLADEVRAVLSCSTNA
jgi:hypothetical protein